MKYFATHVCTKFKSHEISPENNIHPTQCALSMKIPGIKKKIFSMNASIYLSNNKSKIHC
jgi:hypothetical protein